MRSEIVEMARRGVNASGAEQQQREILVRASRGDAQDRVPARLYVEASAGLLQFELAIQFAQISANSHHDLGLKSLALIEKCGESVLDWRVHRKIGVGDDFKASVARGF